MNASRYEQEFAQTRGVSLRYWSSPRKLLVAMTGVCARVEFESAPTPVTGLHARSGRGLQGHRSENVAGPTRAIPRRSSN